MASMSKRNSENTVYISPEIQRVIADGQKLVSYIAREGQLQLDPELTESVISAKHKLANNEWSEEDENKFLMAYDKLAAMVYPVTVESIDAVIPNETVNKGTKTKAERAVAWYRRYTMLALICLIMTQVYWLFGNDLRVNLHDIFEAREKTRIALFDAGENPDEMRQLESRLKIENQQLDANYKLLLLWNKVWTFGGSFELSLPLYFKTDYEIKKKRLLKDPDFNEEKLAQLELQRSLHEVRIVFFENILSADFILSAFQNYLLPLLYGLLGAFIYVLRELLKEIKHLTYSFDSEIRYRLRLTLGALGGMIIGWFLRAEESTALASMSPMALAFLMGYNVEVLFSIMDKIIDNIRKTAEQAPPQSAVQSAPQPASQSKVE